MKRTKAKKLLLEADCLAQTKETQKQARKLRKLAKRLNSKQTRREGKEECD